jgi:hypothetical protein
MASPWRLWRMSRLPWHLSSLYRIKNPPNDPLVIPYDLRKVYKRTRSKSVKKHVCSWGFRRLEPAVWPNSVVLMHARVPENFDILELYPHTNTDLGVLQLIRLVWTRDTTPCMVLDLHFEFMEKNHFSTPQMPKSGTCNSYILCPLCSSCRYLSIIIHNTYTHVKDKEKW